jgi:nitrogen fixation/metabolism regulation signal transduction histidine kinase
MIRTVLVVCAMLGLLMVGLLYRASSNNAEFATNYTWLFGLALTLIVGLFALIGYQIWGLATKLRGQVFGAKLALRMMLIFVAMAIIPGGLLYALSVQFLNRTIDSWFDAPIERGLDSGINLGRITLEFANQDLVRKARRVANALTDKPQADAPLSEVLVSTATPDLRNLRLGQGVDEIILYADNGSVITISAAATGSTSAANVTNGNSGALSAVADKPTAQDWRELREKPLNSGFASIQSIENLNERGLYLRVFGKFKVFTLSGEELRFIQLIQAVPAAIAQDAQAAEAAKLGYGQLALQRGSLKQVFALTLTLAMLLTLFSAIALAFFLADRLSAPLAALADSTRAIARGDFSQLHPVKSNDEFGVLTQSFNTMTRQLGEASNNVALKQHELENAKAYLESILGNLTSGVMAFDEKFYPNNINKIAEDMLNLDHDAVKGLALSEWPGHMRGDKSVFERRASSSLATLVEEVTSQFAQGTKAADKPWERQIEYANASNNTRRTLLLRGVRLPASLDPGYIVVLDDVTNIIQSQRDAAWGEVARRLAHEIKNPLTPIQLSAERLQYKLGDKLGGDDAALLKRSTNTIVEQVGALKSMVDEFSIYSRSARIKPEVLDFNELLRDVLVMYESMNIKLVMDLEENLVPIFADRALLRQVIHNLMQNAIDATAGAVNASTGAHSAANLVTNAQTIIVRTRKTPLLGGAVQFSVCDSGSGINQTVRNRIFEPYVTTKPKGTGLGLAIVKKIIDEHGGSITIDNNSSNENAAEISGATVTIVFPLHRQVTHSALVAH